MPINAVLSQFTTFERLLTIAMKLVQTNVKAVLSKPNQNLI